MSAFPRYTKLRKTTPFLTETRFQFLICKELSLIYHITSLTNRVATIMLLLR